MLSLLVTFFFSFYVKTISVGGVGFFLVLVGYSSSYYVSLTLMVFAICCGGFHGGGILVNPQDLAPKYSGSVFGECLINIIALSIKFVKLSWLLPLHSSLSNII